MKLGEAQKVAELVLRPVKMTEKEGNRILGRFLEVRTIPRPDDPKGDSRIVVLKLEDTNMDLSEDQVSGEKVIEVYMTGQLDYLIAQVCGKVKAESEPMLLITYCGMSEGVETKEFGTTDVHRFTVAIVPEKAA